MDKERDINPEPDAPTMETEPQRRYGLVELSGPPSHPSIRGSTAAFCFEDPRSPVGQHIARTLTALARRGRDVHVFSRKDFELNVPRLQCYPVGDCSDGTGDLIAKVHEFGKRACHWLLKEVADGCSDLTLLGYEWSSIPAMSILRGMKHYPSILSLSSMERQRSDMTQELNWNIEKIEMDGLREAHQVILQCPNLADVVSALLPDCLDKMVPACRPFPRENFQPDIDPGEVKARYQVGPIDPTIVYVGDLSDPYGPDLLLQAMPALFRNTPQVRLIVVGHGEQYGPLQLSIRDLHLEHAVRLVGGLEGPPLHELIAAADMVMLPSREPTPWWPIQAAWSAKRPVVATHHAAPQLLVHEQNSVLCYSSVDSCVWGVEQVLFKPKLARTIAEQGHAQVDRLFGWNAVAQQIEDLSGTPQTACVEPS